MKELLAKLLRERGTDLGELAKAVGTSRHKLVEMLEGKRKFPADLFVEVCRHEFICLNQLQEAAQHGKA